MIEKILILTAIVELLSILGRAAFGSMRKIHKRMKKFIPVRIHHGYIGLICLIMSIVMPGDLFVIVGVALLASDVIHHFIVLPVLVRDTEFP